MRKLIKIYFRMVSGETYKTIIDADNKKTFGKGLVGGRIEDYSYIHMYDFDSRKEVAINSKYVASVEYEEIDTDNSKEQILDDHEKNDLRHSINACGILSCHVQRIAKLTDLKNEYICLQIPDDFAVRYRCPKEFPRCTMYEGMELGKWYTPKELGL